MTTAVAKRDPIVVKIRVKSEEYPNSSKCGLCGGEVERVASDHPRNVDYDEGWVTILLVGLPMLICKGACRNKFVLEKVCRGLDGTVKRALAAIDEGRDLKTAHLNTSAGELIGTETPALCPRCKYGYVLPTMASHESQKEAFECFKCLYCGTEFLDKEQRKKLKKRIVN